MKIRDGNEHWAKMIRQHMEFPAWRALSLPAQAILVITVPEQLARQVITDELHMMPLPSELRTPPFTVSQIWHERFTKDPAHQWLRRLVRSASQKIQ